MLQTVTRLRVRLGLTAIASVLSLSVNAESDDIRIGRYQTVIVDVPLEVIDAAPRLQPRLAPDDIATRGESLPWIAEQHGYRLHDDARRLLTVAAFLSAPLSADERQRPAETLRVALRSLLDNHLDVLVDSGSKEVSLSMTSTSIEAAGDADASQ